MWLETFLAMLKNKCLVWKTRPSARSLACCLALRTKCGQTSTTVTPNLRHVIQKLSTQFTNRQMKFIRMQQVSLRNSSSLWILCVLHCLYMANIIISFGFIRRIFNIRFSWLFRKSDTLNYATEYPAHYMLFYSLFKIRFGLFINSLTSLFEECNLYTYINSLNTKRRLLYLKIQFVPRCKHFSFRL